MFYSGTNGHVYVKSKNIKVFPCGRRKIELLESNEPNQYIPIDPEARLNTEANNRKHSGLNGYKQSYFNYLNSDGELSIVLAGYLFNIKITPKSFSDAQTVKEKWNVLGNLIETALGSSSVTEIYVNILTSDITFFSSVDSSGTADSSVSTEILRDIALSVEPSVCLDLQIPTTQGASADNYYFSGLSFSSEKFEKKGQANHHAVSELFLKKIDSVWQLNEKFRLPKIDHGDDKNSVDIPGSLTVGNGGTNPDTGLFEGPTTDTTLVVKGDTKVEGDLNVTGKVYIGANGGNAITLNVEPKDGKWQLQFTGAAGGPEPQ